MRIAFFVNEFPLISETFVINQIAALKKDRHQVSIYPTKRGSALEAHKSVGELNLFADCIFCLDQPVSMVLRALKIMLVAMKSMFRHPRFFYFSMWSLFHKRDGATVRSLYSLTPFLGGERDFDVLFAHFGPQGLRALKARDMGLIQGPIVVYFHGYDVTAYPASKGLDVYKELFQGASQLMVSSDFMVRRLAELGAPLEKINKIPLGVDIGKFRYRERALDREHIYLVTVGRFVEFKGYEYALKAFSVLVENDNRFVYRIIGDGELSAQMHALATELGISERVEFLGALTSDRVVQYLHDSDIFILPGIVASDGRVETQGMVLLEAQASGLPVVASNIGGIRESVVDNESGFLVPPKDISAIVDRIRYLVVNPDRLSAMGKAGREHVVKHYNSGTEMQMLMSALCEVSNKWSGYADQSGPGL